METLFMVSHRVTIEANAIVLTTGTALLRYDIEGSAESLATGYRTSAV